MHVFRQPELMHYFAMLKEVRCSCAKVRLSKGAGAPIPSQVFERFQWVLNACEDLARTSGFEATLAKVTAIKRHYSETSHVDVSKAETDLRNIEDVLRAEMGKVKLLQVRADHSEFVDNNEIFGSKVAVAFPNAISDLTEAGNCIAADCNTAAVFHLMRAVEWAIRAFATHLGFKNLKTRKSSGKVKLTPVSYSDWEHVLTELQARVDKRVNAMKRGVLKQKAQEFYYPVLQDLRGIRDAWRNHVMHTRQSYSDKDAEAMLDHVKRLMTRLATRVTEA